MGDLKFRIDAIVFAILFAVSTPCDSYSYGVGPNDYDFVIDCNAYRKGDQLYKINADSSTVTLVDVGWGGGSGDKTSSINFANPVVNPNDGKEYIITAVGNGEEYLCVSHSEITPNVRRIEDYAFAYTMSLSLVNTINDNCVFDYYGYNAVTSEAFPSIISIADNGILYLDNNIPQTLRIGKNVQIYSNYGLYTYQPSKKIDFSNLKIYSYSSTPPKVQPYQDKSSTSESTGFFFTDNADSLYRADHTTVYVPYGCREAYVADPEWGKFENIREMAYDPASGIDDVVADEVLGISVATEPSALRVTAPGRHTVSVYAISGMLVKRAETADDGQATIAIEAGAYIVKVGERFVRKVVVR